VTPLWAKAPFVLLRFPRIFLALAFGALLLAVASVSFPLFISATTSDLLASGIRGPAVTRFGAGITYRIDGMPLYRAVSFGPDGQPHPAPIPQPAQIDRLFSRAMAEEPLLGPTVTSVMSPTLSVGAPGASATVPGRLFAGTGALDHVHVLSGNGSSGVWLPDVTAEGLGAGPGDTITVEFTDQFGSSNARVRVAGVYRALVNEPEAPYWHAWNESIYLRCPTYPECPTPPQFLIMEADEAVRLFEDLRLPTVTRAWQAPIAPGAAPTRDEARDLVEFGSRFGAQVEDADTEFGEAFRCCGAQFVGNRRSFGRVITNVRSDLSLVVQEAERRLATIEEPGRVLVIAGVVVAVAVIAASGAFAMTARRVEAQLLFSRGARPTRVLLGSALEALFPCVVGVAAGLGLSLLLLRVFGPQGPVGAGAVVGAVRVAGIAAGVAIALIGIVSTAAFLRHSERHRAGFAILGRAPWELALVALAVYSWNRLSSGGAFVEDRALGIERPSILLLAFPLVAISGVGGLLSRAFDLVMRRLRGREARSTAVYLAVRRLGGGSRLPALLVAASILSLGLAANAAIVAGSIQTTVDAKARAFVGSDAYGRVLPDQLPPEQFPLPVTKVRRRADAGDLVGTDQRFDLLVIDASSFSRVAYWNDAFADASLEAICAELEGPSRDALPIVISGGGDIDPTEIDIGGRIAEVRTVARARAFPGMVSLRPLVIADEEWLRAAFEGFDPVGDVRASAELWVKGDPDEASAALQSMPFPAFPIITAQQVRDIPEFTAVIGTFAVMDAAALAAALLVVIVMLMYLQARQRSQLVAFGLSMRMGMTHATHRRSLVLELATMLMVSLLAGLILGTVAAWMVVPLLDPLDTIPPSPLFVVPVVPIVGGALALAVISWLGGLSTERRARHVDLGEVMRVAE